MPITINDCKVCKRRPNISHEVINDQVEIVIWCVNGHWREVRGRTVLYAIDEWNYRHEEDEKQ